MSLGGFRVLGPEPFDKAHELGNLALLVLVSREHLFLLSFTLLQIIVVVASELPEFALAQLDD